MREVFAVLAWLLVLMPVVNVVFVVDSVQRWRRIGGPLLYAFVLVKVIIWGMAVFVGLVSLRYLVGLPGLPANGIGLAVVLLVVNLIPAYIWLAFRRAEDEDPPH